MPKATAVWLVENTSLTFKQIATFCSMHELEVKGIADGEVAQGIVGIDPITVGQLTQEEITLCEQNPNRDLHITVSAVDQFLQKKGRSRYTPMARRHDKPDAIYWMLKNYPDISDYLIVKLVGTTRATIATIRNRTHWNMKNIRPRDPVLLGLCTQTELDNLTAKYAKHDAAEQETNKLEE